jgi:hypothetical protein
MTAIQKTLAHTYQTITAVNALIRIKALIFHSPLQADIMPDLLPSDPIKRSTYFINLYKYARLKLLLKEGMKFQINDMETGKPLAFVLKGKVSYPAE